MNSYSDLAVATSLSIALSVVFITIMLALVGCSSAPAPTTARNSSTHTKTVRPTPTVYNLGEEFDGKTWCVEFGYRVGSDAFVQCQHRWERSHRLRAQAQ